MNQYYLTITIYSHHFSCTKLSPKGNQLCLWFAQQLVMYGYVPERGKLRRTPLKVFGSATLERCEFRFHINSLKKFEEHLRHHHCPGNMVEYIIEPMYEPQKVDLPVYPNWVPRDYQIPIVEYLVQEKPISKLVGIQTGQGKSLSAMLALSKIGLRTVIIIKPAFIEKWIDDFNKTFNIDKDDVLVVKGASQLKALIVLAMEDKITEKLIIISNKTFQSWMSLYEKYKDETLGMGYDIRPFEIFRALKAGVRLIDEVHMAFHNCFKMDLYTHVPTSIALSATLVSEEPFIAEMHKLAYPLGDRYKDTPLTKYIESYAMLYRFNRIDNIRTTEYGSSNFSMNAVEKSIMRYIPTLNNYFKLIDYTIDISFIRCTRAKKKLLIFASTVDMCTLLVNHLKYKYPQFDIRRYVAEDEYTDLIESQICVSTLGSAGTAVDLPDLTTVILTTMISSVQSNIQSLGRLRKLNDNYPVQFYYFVATDIPKSMEYHGKKKILLSERCSSFREYHSGHVL